MNKLLKRLLTLLSLGSSSLTTIAVSCNFYDVHKNNQFIKDRTEINDKLDGHSNQFDTNDHSNQASDNQTNLDDNQPKIDPVDYSTNHITNNIYNTDRITIPISFDGIDIYNNETNLEKINSIYLKQTADDFKEIKISDKNIEKIILNTNLSSNFYSHPDFELNLNEVVLDEFVNKTESLKLINKKTKQQIQDSEIKWYQKTVIPNDAVFKVNKNQSDKVTFNLLDNGKLEWKDNSNSQDLIPKEETQAKVFAFYKGYLYSANVRVLSKEISDLLNKATITKQKAKEIVEENKWKELPTLERLKQAYNWITKNVAYDFNENNLFANQNAYTALVLRNTVCTGYAKGFKFLLDELDIPCKFVEGDSSRENGAKHAWNQVQIDGKWYYVDATSDRVDAKQNQQTTDFTFFLNTDEDFSKDDKFTRNNDSEGAVLRNIFSKNFVATEEDVLGLIDNNYDPETRQMKDFVLYTPNGTNKGTKPNYNHINSALNKRQLEPTAKRVQSKGSNLGIQYIFDKKETSEDVFKQLKIKILSKVENKNAIKIEFDQDIKDLDLTIKNFNITNALIKDIKKEQNSYILDLYHFTSFGKVKVKLESVKRKDYKFTLPQNSEVEIEVKRESLPDIDAQVIGDNQIKIISNDNNLEYSFEYSKWTDVPENFIIDLSARTGNLYIRSKNALIPEIKTISFTRFSSPDYQLKIANNNTIIGVNDSMEYKLKDSETWINVTKNQISSLNKGIYQIRVKSQKQAFSSEIVEITI
ncbi:transglutaminase domain-containing protein [Mycoplasma putrefaciens]|uniref:MAG6410 family transglutaminase-related lipoprotein n=1 Tax=Mycoplasma putrefaciens TaxID=2123 RepID=UPI003DA54BA0